MCTTSGSSSIHAFSSLFLFWEIKFHIRVVVSVLPVCRIARVLKITLRRRPHRRTTTSSHRHRLRRQTHALCLRFRATKGIKRKKGTIVSETQKKKKKKRKRCPRKDVKAHAAGQLSLSTPQVASSSAMASNSSCLSASSSRFFSSFRLILVASDSAFFCAFDLPELFERWRLLLGRSFAPCTPPGTRHPPRCASCSSPQAARNSSFWPSSCRAAGGY